jgi:hypothetical protein
LGGRGKGREGRDGGSAKREPVHERERERGARRVRTGDKEKGDEDEDEGWDDRTGAGAVAGQGR